MRALALSLLGSAALAAQQPTIKVRVDAVTVDVLVTDDGSPIAGLAARDFELRDNGVLQTIDRIDPEAVPLDVVLVLDVSGSVSGQTFERLAAGARASVRALRAGDRGAVLTFSNRLTLRSPLTDEAASIERALERAHPSGSTALYDAAFLSLLVAGEPGRRTLVLLYTDGIDTSSWLRGEDLAKLAARSDAVIYAIAPEDGRRGRLLMPGANLQLGPEQEGTVLPSRPQRVNGRRGLPVARNVLSTLTDQTGGRVLVARSERDLERMFSEIVGETRQRYLMRYYPEGVPHSGWHQIDVRLKGRRGKIQARKGYFAD